MTHYTNFSEYSNIVYIVCGSHLPGNWEYKFDISMSQIKGENQNEEGKQCRWNMEMRKL